MLAVVGGMNSLTDSTALASGCSAGATFIVWKVGSTTAGVSKVVANSKVSNRGKDSDHLASSSLMSFSQADFEVVDFLAFFYSLTFSENLVDFTLPTTETGSGSTRVTVSSESLLSDFWFFLCLICKKA